MNYKYLLEIVANWAAILTAVIATTAYARFTFAQRRRRKAMEDYLREEKFIGSNDGRRTVLHLMAYLRMTEAEVFQAGFQSRKIKSVPGVDEQGRSVRIYFEYDGDDLASHHKLR